MDAKKVEAGNRALQNHQRAVQAVKPQSVSRLGKPPSLLDGLTRISQEGLKVELTPREEAQFKMAQAAELAAKEAKFTI